MRGKFLFRNKFAPIFCKSNVIRNKEELQRNNDRKHFSLYRLNRILFNWKKTLNILIPCGVDTVVHIRSSSAVTLGTINTWMGDHRLEKHELCALQFILFRITYFGQNITLFSTKTLFPTYKGLYLTITYF